MDLHGFTLTNEAIKFRANNDWKISWGDTVNSLTTDNGDNIAVTAGTYNIKLHAWTGSKGKCEMTQVAPSKHNN